MRPVVEAASIAIFALVLAVVASERLHRTTVALAGAAVAVLAGLLSQEEAIEAVDWGVLGLLAGMMVLVWGAEQAGIFAYLAVKVGQLSRGRPARLMFGLTGTTAVLSAFLDNVTTVLLVVPITFVIADALEIDAVPLIVAEVIASNVGGAATLIGDPPNILIAGASGLGFIDFIVNVGPPAVVAYLVTTAVMYAIFRRGLVPAPGRVELLDSLDASAGLGPRRAVVTVSAVLALTIAGFFVHGPLGVEPPTVALSGATLLLLAGGLDVDRALEGIEWPTLFFFVGLFVLVGALAVNGVLERVAEGLADATDGSKTAEVLGVAWVSAIASGLVDNIPFTAAMAPVVDDLSGPGDDTTWWALSIGACYGGNLTLIAASANLVAAGAVRRAGLELSFMRFLKVGVPATLVSMVVGTLWLLVLV
jgi:Na+/H+ antiporter NhaD/arsenite permease-like protein